MIEKPKGSAAIDGMMEGLNGVMDRLGDLASKLDTLKDSGISIHKEETQKHAGFSVKLDINGVDIHACSNKQADQRDEAQASTTQQNSREPVTQIIPKADYLLVMMEMPGIDPQDISISVVQDCLTLIAETGNRNYSKKITLPYVINKKGLSWEYHHGILEICCVKESQ